MTCEEFQNLFNEMVDDNVLGEGNDSRTAKFYF